MGRSPRRTYTQEFREQAVRLVDVDGVPIKEAARRLSLPTRSLKKWLNAACVGNKNAFGEPQAGQKPLTGMEREVARAKIILAGLKLERDLLEKFAAF